MFENTLADRWSARAQLVPLAVLGGIGLVVGTCIGALMEFSCFAWKRVVGVRS